MHGMLSLAVLAAASAGLAGWIGYLLVRLYRACPADRVTAVLPPSSGEPAGPPEDGGSAEEHGAAPAPVAWSG
jgi:hypothetical protein